MIIFIMTVQIHQSDSDVYLLTNDEVENHTGKWRCVRCLLQLML